jgi:hypothetical protein
LRNHVGPLGAELLEKVVGDRADTEAKITTSEAYS